LQNFHARPAADQAAMFTRAFETAMSADGLIGAAAKQKGFDA
jgi:hypothetical protein